ncbi:MAG: hypothetical protein ACJ8F3_17690 [Xanthobacteraceae bacterium]
MMPSTPNPGKPIAVQIHDLSKSRGRLKIIGGSISDDWNNVIANQAVSALWLKNSDAAEAKKQRHAAVDALIGIAPRDELEGMIAAQLVACHNASMECYRRAMHGEQSFEARKENLSQANKLSRTYATLLECLNRHRGKGQQKVTVEHVHVHAGGQAVVGTVEHPGGGVRPKTEDQAHAIAHAPSSAMLGAHTPPDRVPLARDVERPLPDARRPLARGTEGK